MYAEFPMQRVACTDTTMTESPSRNIETGYWIKSPNSPGFPNQATIRWPLDGTYNVLGEANPKVT